MSQHPTVLIALAEDRRRILAAMARRPSRTARPGLRARLGGLLAGSPAQTRPTVRHPAH